MEKYEKIENQELQELLKYVKDEPLFFGEEKRLLSKSEIANYKNEFSINIDVDIIPLIDLYNNNFLIYNIVENKFQIVDLSDDTIWKNVDSIRDYISKIAQH